MAGIGKADPIPLPPAVTAVAAIRALFAGFLDGLGLQKIDVVAAGADGDVTGHAIVAEQFADFRPTVRQSHHFVRESTVAHQAGVRVHFFPQSKGRSGAGRGDRGLLAGIAALMAGRAFHVHQAHGKRAYEMSPVKAILGALVSIERLIPCQGVG